jgi:Fe-S cluster assembly protein SufD
MTALPSPKLERWKYSNVGAYVSADWDVHPISVQCDIDAQYIAKPFDVQMPWAQETYGDMELWHGLQDVLNVHIPADTSVGKPVHLNIETETGKQNQGSIHIRVDANSTITLFENIAGDGWCNRSITIELGENATFNHIRTGAGSGFNTNLTQVDCATGALYNAYALNNYAGFSRDQIHVRLNGENGKCYLGGCKILDGDQHNDTTILIEHMAPNCYSNQNYRNVLNGQSRGVFQGKVYVDQIAQQTDGYQLCNTILQSDRAEMSTKPELEIYADDVKCSHGATTAQTDEEPLFYLQARGIPKDQARTILMQSFVTESLEAFEDNEDIYEQLSAKINDALGL